MKQNAELRNLAKDLKNATAKVSPKMTKQPAVAERPKKQIGKRSKLPTDSDWRNFHYSVFDAVKNDRGHNDYLLIALARCVKRSNSSVR